jgi:hypothetical protein
MARRQPTAEQKQKAAERRERFRELAKRVAAMSEDERAALVMRCGAIVTVEGRPLSVFNSCLVLSQLPSASLVGGFRQWLAHGRQVRKGAVGIAIWVPTGPRAAESNGPADASYGGEPIADAVEDIRTRFVMGTVFDVSQTQESTRERS